MNDYHKTKEELIRELQKLKEENISLKEESQQKLLEQTHKVHYEMIVEKASDGFWLLDKEFRTVFVNPSLEQMLGFTKEEMLGRSWYDFGDAQWVERAKELEKRRERGIQEPHEFLFIHKDGRKILTRIATTPLFDKNGNFAGAIGILSDITKQKEALLESEKNYKLLFDSISDSIFIHDTFGNILSVNQSACLEYGYSYNEFILMNIQQIEAPEFSTDMAGRVSKLMEDSFIQFETIDQRKDKTRINVDINAKKIVYNGQEAIVSICRNITERKQADRTLVQMQENYETFFNAIDDFLFVLDDQGNIIHTNSTVINRLGYSVEELIGESVLMVHPPERRAEAGRIVGEMLSGMTEFCPVPVITKAGFQIPVETRVSPGIWDGRPAIFGVTKDISRISLSEEKFSKLFHTNPSACGLSDLTSRKYLEVNEAFYTLFGFEKNEVIGKTAFELGIFSIETSNEILKKADSNGKITNVETVLKTKTGETKHVLLSTDNIYVQDKKMRYTVVHDITEHKRAEEKLQQSNHKLEAVISASPDGIGIVSLTGQLLLMSDKLVTMYGYSIEQKKELFGKSLFEFIAASDHKRLIDNIHKLLTGEKFQNITEYLAIKNDNSQFYVDVNSAILCDVSGNPENILFVERDITERKQAELIIQQQNHELTKLNADKDRFMSILAHDLRSPFNSLLGFSSLLLKNLHKYDIVKIETQLKLIHQTSFQTYNLLEDLLLWSKSQSGKLSFEPKKIAFIDICNEIMEYFTIQADSKGIKLNSFQHKNTYLTADLNMFKTILRNLVSNAIKFTNTNGKINIYTEINNDTVIITVSDNGVGISKEDQTKLWNFTQHYTKDGTANEKGTGLGLLLCKEFVEKHGGQLWVESELETGSDFKFTMPLCED